MKSKLFTLGLIAISTIATADSMVIYPNKGQSEAQQEKDKAACYQWAQKQVGYSPQDLLNQQQQAQANKQRPLGSAAKGAAVGAGVGAIAGNTGTGAAVGAGTAGAARAHRNRKAEQAGQADTNQKLTAFNKSEAACLEGKGYSVK